MISSVGLPTCMEGMMYPVPFSTPQQIVELAQQMAKYEGQLELTVLQGAEAMEKFNEYKLFCVPAAWRSSVCSKRSKWRMETR